MTDREQFHAAIRAAPDDLTAQMVFADWLDEHGGSDADRARAAFVRCTGGRAYRLFHPRRGAWLDTGIGKLFPHVLAANMEAQQEKKGMTHAYEPTGFDRDGRRMTVAAAVPWEGWVLGPNGARARRGNPLRSRRVWCRLTYAHGFAETCAFRDERDFLALGGLVLADEPCVRFKPSDTFGGSRFAHGWHVYRQDWENLWDLIPRDDVIDIANLHGREVWLLFGPKSVRLEGKLTRKTAADIGKNLASHAVGRAMDAWAAKNVGKQLIT